jgi:hypothetical protein
MGSRHDHVTVYAVAPPAAADSLLNVEQRLREKLKVAQRTIGIAGRILPSAFLACDDARGTAERRGAVDARLRAWLGAAPDALSAREPIVAAVTAPAEGFLCALRSHRTRLVANLGRGIDESTATIEAAVQVIHNGSPIAPDAERVERAKLAIEAWLHADRGSATIDFTVAAAARSRRRALERVSQAMARAPRHRRAQLADLAAAARQVATAPLGEGAERILETLVKAELPDEAWLRSLAMFGELNVRPEHRRREPATEGEAAALILFLPTEL